jgi:hypothetical protein
MFSYSGVDLMAKAKADKPTKADMIRQTAESMDKPVRPRDIIAALKAKGVTVTSPQVSATLKRAGFRRRRRHGRKSAAAAPVAANGLTLNALVAAKDLIHKAGSVRAAEQAILAIKKLGA